MRASASLADGSQLRHDGLPVGPGYEFQRMADQMNHASLNDRAGKTASIGSGKPFRPSTTRNGYSKKTVLTENAKIDVRIPRDRAGTFDPKLIQRYQRRFPGFDDKIVSMYARGMSVREIQGHLAELYGIDISPDLISTVTDAILETVSEWENRPLEASYPLVLLDALRVKIRDEGLVRNKAVHIALGVAAMGPRTCSAYGSRTLRARSSGSK